MNTDKRIFDSRLFAIILAMIATILSLLGSVSLEMLSPFMQVVGSFTVGVIVYALVEGALRLSFRPERRNATIAKAIATLIVAAIIISTYTAIKSLWFSPLMDNFGQRFVYENTATGVGFAGIVLTLVLSSLQNDIYWLRRKSTLKLDERQVKQRQEVFEASYKYSTVLIFGLAYFFSDTIRNIPTIMANGTFGREIPGHLYWLPANLVVTLIALPLIIAAWKKK